MIRRTATTGSATTPGRHCAFCGRLPVRASKHGASVMNRQKLLQWTAVAFILLLVNTAYIAAFASPTVFYMGNVLIHLVLGVALTVALLFFVEQFPTAGGFFLIAAALGAFLAVRGNTTPHRWALVAHVVAAAIGLVVLAPFAMQQ